MKNWLFSFLFFWPAAVYCQDSSGRTMHPALQNETGRKWLVGGLTAAAYGGSFAFLSTAWYNEYPKAPFHFFNDNGEWLQVDKVGHAWTAYQTSRVTTGLWRWAGVAHNPSILLGTGSSLLYMLSIEYLDGRSAEWGWSWGDAGADIFGAGLFAAQESAWKEQRLALKFSSSLKKYPEASLQARADELFGRSLQERLLKDYNAQTYWLSGNLRSFFPRTNLPAWLNIAVGYGADGMYGGYENVATNKNGTVTFNRSDIRRYRQWYLAPDVDLTRIKTNNRVLHTVLTALNVLKFPAPALEFSRGKLHLRALAY